jgi:putative intracellular protease/amidase
MNMKTNRYVTGGVLALAALINAPDVTAASPRPVLLVIANQDFYYREYSDTRASIEALGVPVRVAAASATRAIPHPNTGQPIGSNGVVKPDLALPQADASDYSAIAFVGGWGASVYQYAYNDPNLDGRTDNFYRYTPYNADDNLRDRKVSKNQVMVNRLINDFVAQDKYVAAICHGVTVLAWARVDGQSPLDGRVVSVPFIGSPATFYMGTWYGDYELSQYEQVVANGAFANESSGAYGDPDTAVDDVVVDGRIITGENYDSASVFGTVIAQSVIAASAFEKSNP